MGRHRDSKVYRVEEKQLLLRVAAEILPRGRGMWLAAAERYNALRDQRTMVARDGQSLMYRFRQMYYATRRGADDLLGTRAEDIFREMQEKIKLDNMGRRIMSDDEGDNGGDRDENASGDQHSAGSVGAESAEPPTDTAPTRPLDPESSVDRGSGPQAQRGLAPQPGPDVGPGHMHPPPPPYYPPPPVTGDMMGILREEAEAYWRFEREQEVAQEERLSKEIAAREERFWREMNEPRRQDREEAAARHEQLMLVLSAVLNQPASS